MHHEAGLRVYGIAGCGFSGSTLLSLMLGAHSKIFGTGEAHGAIRAYRQLLTQQNVSNYCAMHHDACEFWTPEFRVRCDAADLDVLYEHITRHDPGKEVVVHCFKQIVVYAEMLRRSYHMHGLIVLFKRPVAYYSSAKVHIGLSVTEACEEYAQRYSHALKLCSEHRIPVFPLFYDDLANRTENCLRSLCEWLGLEYEPGMIEPWSISERMHLVGGNTGAFMNMWDEPVRNWILQSDYLEGTLFTGT